MKGKRWLPAILSAGCLAGVVLIAHLASGPASHASGERGWFVEFDRQSVPPVARRDAQRLIEIGLLQTDGFSELALSLGGEFKEAVPESGTVGALLIPDLEPFDYLLRNEGQIVFPLEVEVPIGPQSSAIFVSEPTTAKVAFPAYRVFLYNETRSTATVALYVYRTR